MSKRENLNYLTNKNDWSEDTSSSLRKKIKIENSYILSRARKVEQDIDLTEHEVNKFLLIFHTLLETVDFNPNFELEETDGIATDIILTIVKEIIGLLRNNADTLKLPNILKDTLKVLKTFFDGKKPSTNAEGGSMEKESKKCTSKAGGSSTGSSSKTTCNTSSSTGASS